MRAQTTAYVGRVGTRFSAASARLSVEIEWNEPNNYGFYDKMKGLTSGRMTGLSPCWDGQ